MKAVAVHYWSSAAAPPAFLSFSLCFFCCCFYLPSFLFFFPLLSACTVSENNEHQKWKPSSSQPFLLSHLWLPTSTQQDPDQMYIYIYLTQFYFWEHGRNKEPKHSIIYGLYLSFMFTTKQIDNLQDRAKGRWTAKQRDRERERVSRECGALKPKKYQRGPCSLGSGSRLHASWVAKVFEEREREIEEN